MTGPWIELAGWVIAQAIEDACGVSNVTLGEKRSAFRFLRRDPLVDHILDFFDYGAPMKDKREYILRVVIPKKLKEKKNHWL